MISEFINVPVGFLLLMNYLDLKLSFELCSILALPPSLSSGYSTLSHNLAGITLSGTMAIKHPLFLLLSHREVDPFMECDFGTWNSIYWA